MTNMTNKTNETIKQALNSYRNGPPPSKGNGEWVVDPDYEETRSLLGRSFAGTATVSGNPEIEWAAEHLLEDEKDWYTPEQHEQTVTFFMGIPIF